MTDINELIPLLNDPQQRERVARIICQRFFHQLIHIIQRRLSEQLRQRVDAEDILQSAWKSFFRGNFNIQTEDQLLALLSQICVHKATDAARHHTATKRSANDQIDGADLEAGRKPSANKKIRIAAGEEALDAPYFEHDSFVDEDSVRLMAAGASPEHGSMMLELLERLPEHMRDILMLKLKGMTDEEIGAKLNVTRRTVVRRMSMVRDWLRNELHIDADLV